ncbi:MAG: hypothetical protein KY475_22990 [Planctomycetes bacterium]|nr:hypothetical protein [Planctomycetota bacterium]
MGIYAQATGVLLLFAFLFLIFMAAKSWRWHDVTALVLIFLTSMFFVFLAAAVLKTHQEWRTRQQQLAKDLEQEKEQTQLLKTGPLDLLAKEEASLRELKHELERVIADRGRVWRQVQFNGAQDNKISLRFPAPDVAGVDTPPPAHRLQPKTILYAFKEIEDPEGWSVPGLYMGEWVVETPAADSVVLAPLQPLDQTQRGQLNAGGTWVLYEVMPHDAHYKFAHLEDEQIRELLMPGGWHTRPPMAPLEKYEEAVDQYLRDGEEATPADPPERTWIEVELTQPWTQDVDAPDAVAQLPTQVFDVSGRAVTPELLLGGTAEFEPGDKILLDAEAAEKLIAQGIARRGPTIYKRPLRDYAFGLNEIFSRIRVLNEEIGMVTEANTEVQAAIDKGKKQIAYRTDEKSKLTEDLAFVNKERDAMKQYLSTLQTQYNDVRAELYRLYSENLRLVDQLRRIEQAIIAAVRQQLAAAEQ